MLDSRVRPVATNQTFSVEYGILWVNGQLILGGVADKSFAVWRKRHVRRRNTITLIIGDNFYSTVFKHSDARTYIDV